MDAVPQFVNVASVAAAAATAGVPGETGLAQTDDASTFSVAMIGATPDLLPPLAEGRGQDLEAAGETMPDGGNMLPLTVGLVPPAMLTPRIAIPDAASGSAPPVSPAAPIALPSSTMPPSRPAAAKTGQLTTGTLSGAGSPFSMLLARGLRADAVPAGSSPVDAAVTATGTRPPAPVSIATPSVETEALAAVANPLPAAPDAEMPLATRIAEPEMRTAARAPSMAAMPAPDSPTDGLQGSRPPAETGAPPEARFAMAAMDASAINEASAADTQSQTQASADGSHAAPFAAASASLPRSADAPAVMHLSAPVASDGWSDGLGDRIAWMLQQDIGQAHLKLNPPQLGPLEVRVQVNGDQATVAFTAHNQQARDALEGASQRLRDLLGAQGFVNVHVDINQQAFQDRPMIAQPYDDVAPAAPPAARQPTPMTSARGARALLDAYA